MPNNYTFLDSNSSVQTASSSIVSGAHQPIVQIGSVLTSVPVTFSGSPSVSGAVTIIGNPSISGTVNIGTLPGSVISFQGGSWTQSVVGTIFVAGSVATVSSANANQSVSGTVNTLPLGTIISSLVSIVPSSVLVGASIFGQLPAGTAPIGSVATLQGTVPWIVSSIYGNISGSVVAFQGSGWSGSVAATLTGTNSSSVYGMRNDTIASWIGADKTVRPLATDSAGRVLVKPFSAEESRIEGYASLVSTSVTTLIGAAGAGLRNYITDLWFANTGSVTTLITLKDGAGSVLGYTIAPTASGSNLPGLSMPIRTGANATFDFQPATATSILYATAKGFQAP